MLPFKALLENFQHYILGGDSAIAQEIFATPRLEVSSQLEIYRQAYHLRLLEALACDFPNFKTEIGAVLFDRLGRAYIQAHPSSQVSILGFGAGFPDFLSKQCAVSKNQLELAYFEGTLEQARSFCVEQGALVESLSQVPPEAWEDLVFFLNPRASLFESYCLTPQRWQAISQGLELPGNVASIKPEAWLIWGRMGVAYFAVLDAKKRCFFEGIKAGHSFGDICDMLCEQMPEEEVGQFSGQCLNQWVSDQVVVSFR